MIASGAHIIDGTVGFLSYALVDRSLAREVAKALRQGGLQIWFDESDLHSDKDIDIQIWPAILESTYTIVLITKNSVKKRGYFALERSIAERIGQSAATGPLSWGVTRRPLDETVITGYRLVLYLVWEGIDFPTDGFQGDFACVIRTHGNSETYDAVVRNVEQRAPFQDHSDVLCDFGTALSHERLRSTIHLVQEAKVLRRIVREKLKWPSHMAHEYRRLLDSKLPLLPTFSEDLFLRDRIGFCRARLDTFTRLTYEMENNLRLQTLTQFTNDHCLCMELMNRYSFPLPDAKSRCHVCNEKGTILHCVIDAGGASMSEYNDNLMVICQSCGYSWFDFQTDQTGNEWQVFDYDTNTYVEHP